jgi:3-oxoadipate enol-lactonase
MKQVEIPGARLNVVDRGQGSPLLLVHGFPLNHSMWSAQIETFSATQRVIAPDLRGFGRSSVTEGTVTMEQFADDCQALLGALGIDEPITFCGLSMGGYIAWQFARKYGDRLSRLILCDTRAAADSAEAADTRRKMARHVLASGTEFIASAMLPKLFAPSTVERHPDRIEAVRQMILGSDPQGIAAAQQGLAARPDATPWLATIGMPTLVLVGASDAISPPEEMQQIAAAIPHSEYRVIPAAGHMAPMENPDAVNAAMTEFLRS